MKKLSGFGEVFKLFRVENGLSGSVLANLALLYHHPDNEYF